MNRAITYPHEVISIRDLSPSVFVMRLTRNNLLFRTGQHINVGPASDGYTREYSVYSAEQDEFLEVLVKEVIDGLVTPKLRRLKPGDTVMVEEAVGYFYLPDKLQTADTPILLIATGTGIAPYHSFIKTHPKLNYKLIHGVAQAADALDREFYQPQKFVLATSKKNDGDFYGRVTNWLKQNPLDNYSRIYLCGNRNMINDAFEILSTKHYPQEKVFAEAYF